jgi:hypothetical protein
LISVQVKTTPTLVVGERRKLLDSPDSHGARVAADYG